MPDIPSNRPVALSAAIVVHFSDPEHLSATLKSLAQAAVGVLTHLPVAIIDQSLDADYSDKAEAVCREAASGTVLALCYIRHDSNRGYGAGHNRALREGVGESHLILNPDVVLAPQALRQGLQTLAAAKDVVMVAPHGVSANGQTDYLAKRHPSVLVLVLRAFAPRWLQRPFRRQLAAYELQDLPLSQGLQDVPLVSGCCMLARGKALMEVGGFDERFFLYFEDYDLSLRMARHGRVVRDPLMTVVHHGGNASAKGWRHVLWFARGAMRFFNLWGWRWF